MADEDTTVETVATYNYNKVPADTLATIKDIVANDNTISMKVKDGYLILTKFNDNTISMKVKDGYLILTKFIPILQS